MMCHFAFFSLLQPLQLEEEEDETHPKKAHFATPPTPAKYFRVIFFHFLFSLSFEATVNILVPKWKILRNV